MINDATRTTGLGPAIGDPTGTPTSPPGYDFLEEVGHGGMGVVYRARDEALGRDVAIKVLTAHCAPDSPAAVRFLSEARITGQLQHPGIPAVHQVGTLPDGRPFLAMKLIKGQNLETILKSRDGTTTDRGPLVATFEAVCQAVGYAHAHQVIHRDIKPANIMVGAFGEVQVMDWGLAKVLGEHAPTHADPTEAELTRAWTQVSPMPDSASYTQAGSLVGTPAFVAPEQAMGEIDKVDARSDVFGLGASSVVILTGKPPYIGETAEAVRVQAARGKLDDCFARLDASVAERELVALCKKCLAFEPADRPANAGEVAKAVAELRAAADERARRAELERVRVEGEKATADAQTAERRKRRRVLLGAAAILALAVVGGLAAVVVIQQRANKELADEQAKVEARNKELADEQVKVQARFDMAVKAVETFHTGVSEEALLKNPELKALRKKLLEEAAGFYTELEKLLAGQTDVKSRKTLATGYFQLAELTNKIGDVKEALAVHRKALAIRRELAAAPGADVETRLDVARSLHATGYLLRNTGDPAAALTAFQEERDLAAALEAESPTDAVRVVLAYGNNGIGLLLDDMGKLAEALDAYRKALAIYQKLPEAGQFHDPGQGLKFGLQLQAGVYMSIGYGLYQTGKVADGLESFRKASDILEKLTNVHPANTTVKSYLAHSHLGSGVILARTGKAAEAMAFFLKAAAIQQLLLDANPAVTEYQAALAASYNNIGSVCVDAGKPEEGLLALRKGLALQQKLTDANPAVTEFQILKAYTHGNIGVLLWRTGKPDEALQEHKKRLAIIQKLADANPAFPDHQNDLGWSHTWIGRQHVRQKRFPEAFADFERGLPILQKLVDAQPTNPSYTITLAYGHAFRGSAHAHAGHPAEAAADLGRALALWEKGKSEVNETHFERGRALALLAGLGADAKSGVTKDEAKAFADQAVAALRVAISGGWNWPNDLKEPDFDAVRGRDDFQKIFAEVQAKAKSTATKDQ